MSEFMKGVADGLRAAEEAEVQDEATPATDIQSADGETIQPATDEPNE